MSAQSEFLTTKELPEITGIQRKLLREGPFPWLSGSDGVGGEQREIEH